MRNLSIILKSNLKQEHVVGNLLRQIQSTLLILGNLENKYQKVQLEYDHSQQHLSADRLRLTKE